MTYGIYVNMEKIVKSIMGENYVDEQIFVPAGRSFFTTVGKTIAAFSQSSSIDPFIANFGRFYAQLRDFPYLFRNSGKHDSDQTLAVFHQQMTKILGGKIKLGKGGDELEASDGRRIPIHLLSSGQQEVLPLWLVFAYMSRPIPRLSKTSTDHSTMVYIEEPEAHLFPNAQADVISIIFSIVNMNNRKNRIIITTHSPYVLSNINNLSLAQERSVNENIRKKIDKLVPSETWLASDRISAYAIVDSGTVDIKSENLINASYIDEISQQIAEEFYDIMDA